MKSNNSYGSILPTLKSRRLIDMWFFFLTLALVFTLTSACQFYPYGEYLRFIRVTENTPVGETILKVEVHPRHNLTIQPVDRIDDASYFGYRELNSSTIGIVLQRSLNELVDNENPRNVLKFRMICDYNTGADTISSYMSVTVYIEDVNDHAPRFVDLPYHVTVDELTPTGLTLFRGIHAIDKDKPNTPNSDVHYSIVGGNEEGKFALESSHRAILVLKKPLDYDSGGKEYKLRIMASDRGTPPRNSTVNLFVRVSDNDDLSPQFTRDAYKTQITEFFPITANKTNKARSIERSNKPLISGIINVKLLDWNDYANSFQGAKIHKELRFKPPIVAYDADLAINTPVRFDIVSGNEKEYFFMDPKNGSLFLEKEVDLERERSLIGNTFVLQVQASQVDNPLKTGFARVEVEILDINDNLPEFEVDLYNISIVENLPNGFSVLQVIATDRDQGENGEFTFQLDDRSQAFNMDPKSGWLTVRDQSILDREKQSALSMKVYAREKVPNVMAEYNKKNKISSVAVEVTLLDANDNNPTFIPSNLYEFRIPGDARIGDVVGQVKATDPDLGRNGFVVYDLQRSNSTNFNGKLTSFTVNPHSGHILVNEHSLAQGRYALFVEASDQPSNPSERRFSLAVVTIEVLKIGKNELVPDFIGAPYEFWVGGDVPVGTSVGQIRVTDAVDKNDVIYDLLHSYHDGVPFAVEEKSGVISVVDHLKNFERALYDFEALVTNERDMTIVTNMTIHVVDPEEYKQPIIRENNGPIELRVRENMPGALVGQIVRPYESPYSNTSAWWKSLRFVIANQPDVADKFAISSDGTIYTQKGLDREERDVYRLTIIVENTKGVKRGAKVYQVMVIVEDENDNPPVFDHSQYEGHIPENSPGGTEVTLNHLIRAVDSDSNINAQFKYTLYGEGSDIFVIEQATGRIFLRKNIAYTLDREEKQTYMLRVVARDKGNLNSEVKLIITVDDVNDNPPKFLQMVVLHDQDVEIVDSNEKSKILPTQSDIEIDSYLPDSEHSASSLKSIIQLPPLISLSENISIGTAILRLLADDKDVNSTVTYSIIKEIFIPQDPDSEEVLSNKKHFVVHSTNGEIAVATKLSPEAEYRLVVSATDNGGNSDNVTVRIYVKDVNDHPPVFSELSYDFNLLEGKYDNHLVGRVSSTDGDYGDNANVTYFTNQEKDSFPFRVHPTTGKIYVTGDIDRESLSSYTFKITGIDNAKEGERLSSSVDVEIHITDLNDNPPKFYGYDRLLEISRNYLEDVESDNYSSEDTILVPVYYASVQENSPLGIPVIKITVNDSDFAGNGNGLFLFDIIRRKNLPTFFEIDSKEGIVTITNQLDYEYSPTHNITIIASDLGKPSLTSTALLAVRVLDIPEQDEGINGPMFDHRYYEVEIEENSLVPLDLLTVNVSDSFRGQNLKYTIVQGHDSSSFAINSRNGTLTLLTKPDRETKARYEIKVRVDRLKRGRGMATFIYPPPEEKIADLGPNEVKIVVKVKDVNDNSPRFKHHNKPIVAVVPKTTNYGHEILKLHATDPDEGINGDIRYQIMGRREDDDSHKFSIDPLTGQVRSVVSFIKDAGKVYGFDVKAVDRRGADNGRSAIANVFVYILDDEKQVIMVARSKPTVIERNIDVITNTISNITGLEVRARKIEPHIRSDQDDGKTTDLYLYAINPTMNVLVDMEAFHQALEAKSFEIKKSLDSFRVLDFAYLDEPLPARPRAQRSILSALEVAVVVLGCVVFIGAMASAICIGCIERGKKRRRKTYPSPDVGFTLGKAVVKPSHLFPATAFHEGLCPGDTTDTYVDLHSSKASSHDQKRRRSRHDPSCYKNHRHRVERENSQIKTRLTRSNSNFGRLETSLTSLHSSGKDSGITEGRGGVCPCGHSSSHSSGDSTNGSYEDSLKSFQRRNDVNPQHVMQGRRSSMCSRPRQRHSSQHLGPPPPPPAPPRTIFAPVMP